MHDTLASEVVKSVPMPRTVSDEKILEAAVVTVAEHGYSGATTRQIAAAAGINEVTLFRRFGNKANLLREAMVRELSVFEEAGGARHTGDVVADLERIVALYQGLLERRGRMVPTLLAEISRRPELREVIDVPERVIGSVAVVLARYQQEGVLETEPPLRAVASLLAPLMVMQVMQHAHGMEVPPLDVADHVRRFVRGRAAPTSS